jgi:hypothetical protein
MVMNYPYRVSFEYTTPFLMMEHPAISGVSQRYYNLPYAEPAAQDLPVFFDATMEVRTARILLGAVPAGVLVQDTSRAVLPSKR